MGPDNSNDPFRTTDHVPAPDGPFTIDHSPSTSAPSSAGDAGRTVSFVDAARDRAAPSAAVPDVPGYELIEVLGRGGMGVVYKARDRSLKRTVAVKMVRGGGHGDSSELARFRTEAEAVARLQHPNIVQIHEVGEAGGLPYCALEFVDGGNLSTRIGGKPLPPREAARIVESIARGVQLAHSRNVVHRDLKPSNILLTADGVPKIADFGLARQLDMDSGATLAGAVLGTPSYMAPEQASGNAHDAGPLADIYAIGAILYECLTGAPPFVGKNAIETMDRVRTQPAAPPSRQQPGIPLDLETICLKCLRKEPEGRYASAAELADDLVRYLDGRPILGRPIGRLERSAKWVRRNPVLALAAVVVVTTLLVSTIISYQKYRQADTARKEEANRVIERDAALADATAARLKSQRMSAGLAFDRALELCQAGKTADGLLWIAEALNVSPPEDEHFAQVVRTNLAAWRAPLPVRQAVYRHDAAVACVAYAPDGQTFYTASGATVRRRNSTTGAMVGHALEHPAVVFCLAASPDGKLLATGTNDKTVRVWDTATGQLGQTIAQPDLVNSVAFSKDSRQLLVGTGYRDVEVPSTARVWDAATGQPIGPALPHPVTVRSGVFHSHEPRVVTGAGDGLRIWDPATGKLVGKPIPVTTGVGGLAVLDGGELVVGCNGGEVFVYFLPTGRRISPGEMKQQGPIRAVAFHPAGGLIASAGLDGNVRLWDWAHGRPVSSPLAHLNYVNGIAFHPDGQRLLSGSDDKTAQLWQLPIGYERGIPECKPDAALRRADMDPCLVSARPRTRITGEPRQPVPHWAWDYLSAALSADGRQVVTGSLDKYARVWETATGRLVGKPLPHDNWVRDARFTPDGRRVLTVSHDMTARLWDVETGEPVFPPFRHTAEVSAVAISPDGTRALTGGNGRVARLWNLTTGEPVGRPLNHLGAVHGVGFSPDGRRLLTFTPDTETAVYVWDAATQMPLGPPLAHDRSVTAARFTDDGREILTLSDDGVTRRWSVPVPIGGPTELIRPWVEAVTGRALDAGQAVAVLDEAAWRQRRDLLAGSELAADLDPPPAAVLNWHKHSAAAAEVNGAGQAGHWHLDRLIPERPNDWTLRARRAALLHRYGRDAEALDEIKRVREVGGPAALRDWLTERASNLDRLRRHAEAVWFHEQLLAALPADPELRSRYGHCLAALGKFADARPHLIRAAELDPSRIEYRRDVAMVHLALNDRPAYRTACAELIALAEKSTDLGAARAAATACILTPDAVSDWTPVVRLAIRAAEVYEGDDRIRIAALFRSGRIEEALARPWTTEVRYDHNVWEWFTQALLRHRAGRPTEARALFQRKVEMIEFMDREYPRNPSSKVWSDWVYYVQCHTLQAEAEARLR
jgi:WD40 repeat protein/tetratricopeptide (TPR) repeat protein